MDLESFIAKWTESSASERANKDAFLLDLCDVIDVPRPDPATGDRERDRYVFERDALIPHEGGKVSVGKIDLYKEGCLAFLQRGVEPAMEAREQNRGLNSLGRCLDPES